MLMRVPFLLVLATDLISSASSLR